MSCHCPWNVSRTQPGATRLLVVIVVVGDEVLLTAAGADPVKLDTGLAPFVFTTRGELPL